MGRVILLLTAVLVGGVWLAGKIDQDPGYVLIAYNGTTVEMSIWVAALLLLLLMATVWLTKRLVKSIGSPYFSIRGWYRERRAGHSLRRNADAMVAFVEGHWAKASELLHLSARDSEAPLPNYLMAADASHRLGDQEGIERFLGLADAVAGGEIATAITKARIRFEQGDLVGAREVLDARQQELARHPSALRLRVEVLLAQQDWPALQELLPRVERRQALPLIRVRELQVEVCQGLLRKAQDGELHRVWKRLPKDCRERVEVIETYIRMLMEHGELPRAENVLRGYLRTDWDARIVRLYGVCVGADPAHQLQLGESWLKIHENDADLLLSLGRLCLANELWGKAREYFVASVKVEARAETYGELGRLCGYLGEHAKSADYYRAGLHYDIGDLPSLPMPKYRVG